uniref:Uncharacterized protein n=1 Tax=Meloidogyne javanica TaxID=6303 RepID=A0A915LXI0_MELJA
MYTEIRELINFLARYFHLRIPRLRIDEEQRIIRISRTFCDETFTSAANSVGLMLEELLNCLP